MSVVYNTSIVRNGLLVHFDAANLKSYPGTGTVLTDLSGNGKNGSLLNGMTVSDGKFVNPDNRTKAIRIQAQDWSAFSNFTVDIWYKRTGVNNHGTGGPGLPSYYQGIFNYYWDGSNNIFVGTTSNASSTDLKIFNTPATPLALNTWVHITGITGPGGCSAYINGNLVGTGTGITINPNKDVYFGNWDTSWASFCEIGAIKVYSRALIAAEIQQNFEASRGRYGI